jgi:hypothetical protein
LKLGHYDTFRWEHLLKNSLGYIITYNKSEIDKKMEYARRIRNIQRKLGFEMIEFSCLD